MKNFFTLMLMFSFQVNASDVTLGITTDTLNSDHGKFLKSLYTKVFKNLNHNFLIKDYPSIRLEEQVRTGDADGELVRKSDYGKTHPYLVRVDEPHFMYHVSIYSYDKNLIINSINDLSGKHIIHRRGMKVLSDVLQPIKENSKIDLNSNTETSLKLLSLKRVDYIVGIESHIDKKITEQIGLSSKVFKIKRVFSDSAHMYLRKDLKELAEKISTELKRLKSNGEYLQIKKAKN